ncbi:hypothetical protein ACFLZW_01575 [Chloroflexota bacterium]
MIIQINNQISMEIYYDPIDREEGYDDDIRFVIHEGAHSSGVKMLAADEIGVLLTPTQAEQMAAALWQAAERSRSLPWPGRPKKEAQADGSFANAYPKIAEFVKTQGRVELGQDEFHHSLLRARDADGLVWESKPAHIKPDQALLALEEELAGWGQ